MQKDARTRAAMKKTEQNAGWRRALIASAALGVVAVTAALAMRSPALTGASAEPPEATAEYGRRLLRNTALYLGPDHDDPDMRFSGTRMSCASCHLETGTLPGTLSLLSSAPKYPRFSGRDGRVGDLKDRINGCMQRSMNGRALPRDSIELLAMERYILGLNEAYLAMGDTRRMGHEQAPFAEPDRAANVAAGQAVYERRCQLCHGEDGRGLLAAADPAQGYLFPPLWGPDSYNNGAGMNRVLTAAMFINARMPLGQADLTDDEAFDVSAYINAQPRPVKSGLEEDFPDRRHKQVDSPYPPYADDFSHEQHKIGPFRPIREYYKNLAEAE